MDFFAHQDQARRNTTLLVVLYAVSVIALVGSVVALAALVSSLYAPEMLLRPEVYGGYGGGERSGGILAALDWWKVSILSALLLASILLTSGVKIAMLSQGGGQQIARSLGGRPLSGASEDPDEKRLLNIVEEMALASGTPVPDIFILDGDESINAFAAGNSIDRAVIGVTKGTLKNLNRDELQGVIAHEFSHITNGDMRLNVRLIGILFGILVFQQIGYRVLLLRGRGRSSRNDSGAPILFIGMGLWILGLVGYFFAALIKAAVSRQREFLADAAAVQFTRNPGGIGGALRKIGAAGSAVSSPKAAEVSHLFFASGVRGFFGALFATHPKLSERIARIEGNPAALSTADRAATPSRGGDSLSGVSFAAPRSPKTMIQTAGTASDAGLQQASAFLSALPRSLLGGVHHPDPARATVFGIFLSPNEKVREDQLNMLRERIGAGAAQVANKACETMADAKPIYRLPLIDLALPALRSLPPKEAAAFLETVRLLIVGDSRVELFEFCLFKILQHALNLVPKAVSSNGPPPGLADAASVILSELAYAGHEDPSVRRAALVSGFATLGIPPSETARTARALELFSGALDRLERSSFREKSRLLHACAAVVAHDGAVHPHEAELVRAVADVLGCPIPAFQ